MKTIWPHIVIVLAGQLTSGCELDPRQIELQAKADAVETISLHLTSSRSDRLSLRAETNPWGAGFLVFTTDGTRPEDVRVWLFYPDLTWSLPPQKRRDEAFAFGAAESRATPGLPRLDTAERDVQHRFGLQAAKDEDLRRIVFYSMQRGISVHAARAAVVGNSSRDRP
jgi:hypothetical protein